MCASVHTLEYNLPPPSPSPTPPPPDPEKADRSDATIIRVRLPDLLVPFVQCQLRSVLSTQPCRTAWSCPNVFDLIRVFFTLDECECGTQLGSGL